MVRKTTNGVLTLTGGATGTTGAGVNYWGGDYVNLNLSSAFPIDDTASRKITFSHALPVGRWRVFAAIFWTGTGRFQFRLNSRRSSPSYAAFQYGALYDLTDPTTADIYDLGTYTVPYGAPSNAVSAATSEFEFWATRLSGTGTMSVDGFVLVPMDNQAARTTTSVWLDSSEVGAGVIDAEADAAYMGTYGGALASQIPWKIAGGLPKVYPACTNTFWVIAGQTLQTSRTAISYTGSYWPRYLFVRPPTS
jgi:hypothetical protein